MSREKEEAMREEALQVTPAAFPPTLTHDDTPVVENGLSPSKPGAAGNRDTWKIGPFEINKHMLPIKVMYFTYYGAMAAILPYLTIHMKQIGISITQIALIYAVLPVTTFVGPPLCGLLADYLGNYRPVLILNLIANGFFHTALLWVPEYHPALNFAPSVNLTCDTSSESAFLSFKALPRPSCLPYNPFPEADPLQGIREYEVNNCSKVCGGDRQAMTSTKGPLELRTWDSGLEILSQDTEFSLGSFPAFCASALNGPAGDQQCRLECIVGSFPNVETCLEMGDTNVTFWTHFILRFLATVAMAVGFTLLDATVLAACKEYKCDYGKQRISAMFGLAAMSPIAGVLVDVMSPGKESNYAPAYAVADVMLMLDVIFVCSLNMKYELPEENILKNLGSLLTIVEVDVYLVMMFVLGSSWGFLESYLFIYLEDLGAPKYLLGLTLTVGSLVGIPLLIVADSLVVRVGRVNVIVVAFFTYFVRLYGYSYIPNAWWCFPFEAMEAFTYHLMWVAAATYVTVLAPKGLLATLTGVMGAIHFSIGKGAGSFFGGLLYNAYGLAVSFRIVGIFSGVMGLVYLLIQRFYLQDKIAQRQESEALKETQDINGDSKKAMPLNGVLNPSFQKSADE